MEPEEAELLQHGSLPVCQAHRQDHMMQQLRLVS